MKQFSKILLLTLGFGLFAVVLSYLPSHKVVAAPPTPSVPVNVTNTPLPIQGNVAATISGTPNVNITGLPAVQISGTPSVNVASAPPVNVSFPSSIGVSGGPVNVANTQSNPIFSRDVDNPANQPFVDSICVGFATGCGNGSAFFQVPSTVSNGQAVQRAIIEYYSARCQGITSTPPVIPLSVISGGQQYFYYIGPLLPDNSGFFYSNQQTRIYADPGPVSVFLNFAVGSPACFVTVSGHLVLQ